MLRRIAPALLALGVVLGCAGPSRLAQRSEEKLAGGETGRAWTLAVRALDKDPGNARARAAATAAGNSIARDWERRIHVLAQSDTLAAADQVLELAAFRVKANHYAAITVSPAWSNEEQTLRQSAARLHYQHGVTDFASRRPKRAYLNFADAQRFVPDYRDAARRADKAYEKALTRVALMPLSDASGNATLGREVTSEWHDHLDRFLAPETRFTHLLGLGEIEQQMTVSQLGHLSREDAINLGRKAGAERVVWGSIGNIDSQTRLHIFTETIARRVVEEGAQGEQTYWASVPIELVSRVRTVTVDLDYEVIATREGATLAHQHAQRSTSARVVWTPFAAEGDLATYALVSDIVRAAHPDRAREIETRWKEACGDRTTLRQVLEARRASKGSGRYDRDALPQFMTGAAFVFLQDLPPADDLAFAALAHGWEPLRADLLRLDPIDDVDLGMTLAGNDRR